MPGRVGSAMPPTLRRQGRGSEPVVSPVLSARFTWSSDRPGHRRRPARRRPTRSPVPPRSRRPVRPRPAAVSSASVVAADLAPLPLRPVSRLAARAHCEMLCQKRSGPTMSPKPDRCNTVFTPWRTLARYRLTWRFSSWAARCVSTSALVVSSCVVASRSRTSALVPGRSSTSASNRSSNAVAFTQNARVIETHHDDAVHRAPVRVAVQSAPRSLLVVDLAEHVHTWSRRPVHDRQQ